MDTVEQKKDDNAFQADAMEASMTDDDMLEEYRRQRWEDNAKWQLTTFAQSQLGSWEGEIELYELDGEGGMKRRVGPWAPQCSCETAPTEANTEVDMKDNLPGVASEHAVEQIFGPSTFRPELGSMAVASSFSLAMSQEKGWLFEVCIGEEDRRVRCKLLYGVEEGGEAGEGGAPAMALQGCAVVREARGGKAFITDSEGADIDGSPGRGLYDPPKGDKREYCSLYCEGGITLVFPTRVDADAPGCLSLDWIAGRMRYQIDRKFKKLDGSLASLELTEIQKSDAEVIAPDFPHQSGGESA